MLHEFLTANRAAIIARCRAKIASRPAPRPTDLELEYGVPMFLDQLTETLRGVLSANPEIGANATKHGKELLHRGFTVAQVVHDYGGICQTITELSAEHAAPITTDEFQILRTCLDEAIAGAVTEHSRLREHQGTERLGRLAHDLLNLLNSALLSYEMLELGSVAVHGSTWSVLGRSLSGIRNLIDRELAEVRLGSGIHERETLVVFDLIEDIEVPAAMEAKARGLELTVIRPPKDLWVHADRQVLVDVVANLLQNAFKFTSPGGHVVLRTHATDDRVRFEVEDRCGGLAPGKTEDLIRSFELQPGATNQLGGGLEFCARGARVNDGVLHVRNQAGVGCLFSVDLPRAAPILARTA